MPRQRIIDELVSQYGLNETDVFLLNLVPILEIMWADGKLQDAEISILNEYACEWLAYLAEVADGELIVEPEQINAFIERFTRARPDPELLAGLSQLAFEWINASPKLMRERGKTRELYEYCLDIAAAAVSQYPYGRRARIHEEEHRVLHRTLLALGLAEAPV
ncbi:hypothetical protein [Chitinilyticum piscinae]|uniref:Uncharacterized protein n=1 Tax=Chitinilyticum piscinae TaxID=2866724 RepID=A0A8J7FHE4_9NEIS|nr:hypothetical protein [Chitinilyticum piscinae]MBE9609483.1 hypothetical protein [Chitinilyticum piscinae]